MKRFCALGVVFACSMGGVFATEDKSPSAPTSEFSTMQWLKDHKRPLKIATGVGVAGVGGLVGAGFVIKKIVRVAKEAIALKKQLHANPKDMSLRKKRRALIRKAIGLGIGGFVLGVLSGLAVGFSGGVLNDLRKAYSDERSTRSSYSRVDNSRLITSSLNKKFWNPRGYSSLWTPPHYRAPQAGDFIRYEFSPNLIVYRNDTWDFSNAPENLITAPIGEKDWVDMGFNPGSHQAFTAAQKACFEQLLEKRGAASGSDYTNSSFATGPGGALDGETE